MGKEKLTDKQTQILEYIRHEILQRGIRHQSEKSVRLLI